MTTITVLFFLAAILLHWNTTTIALTGACAILCLSLDTRTMLLQRKAQP